MMGCGKVMALEQTQVCSSFGLELRGLIIEL
jgi:hypothetical protein